MMLAAMAMMAPVLFLFLPAGHPLFVTIGLALLVLMPLFLLLFVVLVLFAIFVVTVMRARPGGHNIADTRRGHALGLSTGSAEQRYR